jgi:hypothetical protein
VNAYSRKLGILPIEASGGTIRTLDYYLRNACCPAGLPLTEAEMRRLEAIEITGHAASFYVGTSDLATKSTQPAYDPYFREDITYKHCLWNSIRAVAAAAITDVVVEVWISTEDRVGDITNA